MAHIGFSSWVRCDYNFPIRAARFTLRHSVFLDIFSKLSHEPGEIADFIENLLVFVSKGSLLGIQIVSILPAYSHSNFYIHAIHSSFEKQIEGQDLPVINIDLTIEDICRFADSQLFGSEMVDELSDVKKFIIDEIPYEEDE